MQLSGCFILLTLISQMSIAQGPAAWDRETAQKEIDGMRRYAWALASSTADGLKKMPADEFPAVHAFLRDFDEARKLIDPNKAPSDWKSIDIEALAIRNPNYWAAVYELEPADPLMMWFHSALHAVNGEISPALYSQLLAVRSPTDIPKEMSRLIVSSSRLLALGDKAVQVGVSLHDQEKYDEAEKIFREVLSVIPSHSLALYELGNTLRKKDRSKAGAAAAQTQFDMAKQVDPFRVEAYQGSFGIKEMKQFAALRSQAKPAWDKLMQTPPNRSSLQQLERLSSQLQNAGLYELALLVRQVVVARREASYNEDDVQFIMASLKALMPQEDFEDMLKGLEESDHASALPDIRAIIEAGRDAKSMPADMVVRLYTEASGADEHENTKERWEFSPGKVHRLVINDSRGSAPYRREKTLAFDTTNICRQLLDGKLFVIAAREGTGKARMFAGTAFEGAVGERAIEILIDGEPAVEVGECCLFAGLPKTDAVAFHALYEQLAEQARNAFGAVGVQATENSTRIAVSVLDEEHGGIYVLNADGSGKQRLTKGSSDILPRWSPDGKQIAFLALREQDHELAAEHDLAFHWFLYVMDADGQNQRRVTKTPIGMIFQWSPDGTRFVFQSSCEDVNNKAKDGTASSAIYVMKSDGTQQKRLTPVEHNDGFPSWSPDGKQIAFCSNRHGNKDIFVMNADGSDVRRLTSNEANDSAPTWSPDGKQIAFLSSRESGTAYVVNADGTQESSLAVRGRPVAWSPDGQSLLIEDDGQLVLTGADGRNPKELTQEGKSALDGEYSPDGKAVFYRSKVNGTWTLMSVDTERSSQKRVWSDSGKFLGFSVYEEKRN